MIFPLAVLKAALEPEPEPEPQVDLTPVVTELQKLRAVMGIVAAHPRVKPS